MPRHDPDGAALRTAVSVPHAPVVDDSPAQPRLRRATARALRRMADRVDT